MMMIVLLLILYPTKFRPKKYLIITFVCYALAKTVEIYDREIFVMNHELFSGHTLKHLFAAAGVLSILRMFIVSNTEDNAKI